MVVQPSILQRRSVLERIQRKLAEMLERFED
jgi:hypothetical protein